MYTHLHRHVHLRMESTTLPGCAQEDTGNLWCLHTAAAASCCAIIDMNPANGTCCSIVCCCCSQLIRKAGDHPSGSVTDSISSKASIAWLAADCIS